jgi:hypothetical protein
VDVQTYPPLAKLHQEYEQEFIEAAGFGLSRIPRMSIQPQALFTLEDGRSWRVLQHNLLGIAEHDEPTVLSVSSPSAPRHRDPPGAPPAVKASRAAHMPLRTEREERPLNAFETLAVERMLAGEQGPWIAEAPEEGPHRSRLLGALRARSECLECHTAYQEGEPLGALVYLIEHVQPEMSPEAGNPLFGFAGTPR